MKSTKERLLDFLKYKQLKKSDFYQTTGIKRGFLDSDKLKGTISDAFMAVLIKTYPSLSIYWLVTGNGSMIRDDYNTTSNVHVTAKCAAKKEDASLKKKTRSTTQVYSRKFQKITSSIKGLFFSSIIPTFEKLEIDFVMRIPDFSMSPKYQKNDLVVCKKVPITSSFQWGEVYVIETREGTFIKQIEESATKDFILCRNYNKNYSDMELARKELQSIALVTGAIHIEV